MRPGKKIVIRVYYSGIECECAQWVEEKFPNEKKSENEKIQPERFYLEPANKKLPYADTLWDGAHLPFKLKVTGQFDVGKSIPLHHQSSKGMPAPARVFRYEKIEIISPPSHS